MKKGQMSLVISVIAVAAVIALSLMLFFNFGPKILTWASELTSAIRDSILSGFS